MIVTGVSGKSGFFLIVLPIVLPIALPIELPIGLPWRARVLGRTLLVWLGGPGSWAGPFWFGLGGQGPGPGPAYTINTLDSDKDVNINTFSTNDLFMMLI